jgi:hypothetical protein
VLFNHVIICSSDSKTTVRGRMIEFQIIRDHWILSSRRGTSTQRLSLGATNKAPFLLERATLGGWFPIETP